MLHYKTIDPPLTEEEESRRAAWAERCSVTPDEVPDNVLRFCPLKPSPLSAREMEWAREVDRRISFE